ncbi:MAG: hypothetical protein WBA03_01115, partial [Marinomonas sp.]|uniref:hypothetical protein n=1 Tax=Marinomonas sp. TaxID=1904862 RepID=UPI003C7329A2
MSESCLIFVVVRSFPELVNTVSSIKFCSPCVRIVVASFVVLNKQGTVSENQWITKDIQVPLKSHFKK